MDGTGESLTVLPGKREDDTPIFSVLVKRTYDIQSGRGAARAEEAAPLVQVDRYYDQGDPQTTTVEHESDLVPYKLATDVVVIGKAVARGGEPVRQLDAMVQVQTHRKAIRVYGDRRCEYRAGAPPVITEPEEFTEMDIRYGRAYGGKDLLSNPELPFHYPRNTMGTGLVLRNAPETVDGLRLPNLEDPDDLLTPERIVLGEPERWNAQPLPQGFGWFQKTWYPRCSFVGSVPGYVNPEEPMREESLGLVPENQVALARQFKLPSFDLRFNTGASHGLSLPYLNGGERVTLLGMTPEGFLQFALPREKPRIMLDIGLGENTLEAVLHTVCVRVEAMQVDLVWRGAHDYPGVDWLPEMKRMDVKVA